jgi:hypothetical protein
METRCCPASSGLARIGGSFLACTATRRPVKVWGMVIDRVQDGKIKDTRPIMDTLGLMMQLGVFPSAKA